MAANGGGGGLARRVWLTALTHTLSLEAAAGKTQLTPDLPLIPLMFPVHENQQNQQPSDQFTQSQRVQLRLERVCVWVCVARFSVCNLCYCGSMKVCVCVCAAVVLHLHAGGVCVADGQTGPAASQLPAADADHSGEGEASSSPASPHPHQFPPVSLCSSS